MSLLDKIATIVASAGDILLEKMEAGFSICKKGQIDLVTDADHAVERFLISELKQAFPAASFCAEEQGWLEDNESDAVWFIDPLDGTTNFAHGFPTSPFLWPLAKNGQTVAGGLQPCKQRTFAAESKVPGVTGTIGLAER